MKKILGLDLGTTSIGWALVNEAENKAESSSIIRIGVRVNPLSVDEKQNFEQGKGLTAQAIRTQKRSMRRNLQRYKLRRAYLIDCLKRNGFITDDTPLYENGNRTTFETYRLRAAAASGKISLTGLARVLLMLNKKRGYKSNRKVKSADEGIPVNDLEAAKQLYEEQLTPGQLMLKLLQQGKKYLPDFYRSDLYREFDRVWAYQQPFYPEILTDEFKAQIRGQKRSHTVHAFVEKFQVYTAENKGANKQMQAAGWRAGALSGRLPIEEVAFVISDINGAIQHSSGYLGLIGDRSKQLYFKKQTVGQFLMQELDKNPGYSLKNQVFYRQDYLDEFETIWEKQAEYYPELTPALKEEIRDVIIFYQRRLKSQKGLVAICEFERRQIEVQIDGKIKSKTIGSRVCPKSSPLFQEFRIWQTLHDIRIEDRFSGEVCGLTREEKERLFAELNVKEKLTKTEMLKLLNRSPRKSDIKDPDLKGNRTQAVLIAAYREILSRAGNEIRNFTDLSGPEQIDALETAFRKLGYNPEILRFDSEIKDQSFDKQPLYQLWHLLYAYEGDRSVSGNESLIRKITELCGFDREGAAVLANVAFETNYGSLSTKAIRKILTYMKNGNEYSTACELAGYRHSKRSLSREELDRKVYKDRLELLPRNSLRNPVVEKILNQMIHVVNAVTDLYGKPDEIRIELSRELRNTARQREKMTADIRKARIENEAIRRLIQKEFGSSYVSRNDIVRYKLYSELKDNGYKTLYSNTRIPFEELFDPRFEIEHIVPRVKLFDDSYSNKTLECRQVNIEKGALTAYDYIAGKYGGDVCNYKNRVEMLWRNGSISKKKRDNLLITAERLAVDFTERDLRNSQYIARKACEILEDLVCSVVPTQGSITNRLREDWQLTDLMQELNWEKYDKLGLTEIIDGKNGRKIRRIKDWSKRNDHRHHAVDALIIAFTKRGIVQYLNRLHAENEPADSSFPDMHPACYRDKHGKRRFFPPIYPCGVFRSEVKRHLEQTLVSFKAKNKVLTNNVNRTKKKDGYNRKTQRTPRGQLHNEQFQGSIGRYVTKLEKIGSGFDERHIAKVANEAYRQALSKRLAAFGGDPRKAFTGKNSLEKNPLYLDGQPAKTVPTYVKTVNLETVYTIRKAVSPDLNLEKVVDKKIRRLLETRLEECGGVAWKAFSDLEKYPIWQNKEKGIAVKRVTITGMNHLISLHHQTDRTGKPVAETARKKSGIDYVSTGNNHHVAIYRDKEGVLHERIVSFFEATKLAVQGEPVVDKDYRASEGWTFLFSMKQNECFVFPNDRTGFDPNETDLTNPENYARISPNLFRVQKITTKDYGFRHHLETSVGEQKELQGITWKRYQSLNGLDRIVKVRIDALGRIVSVGEY